MKCRCGRDDCKGTCNYTVGARLYYFFNNMKHIEAKIGEIRQDSIDKRQSFMVTGCETTINEGRRDIGTIMYPLGAITLYKENKFDGIIDAKKALSEYIEKSDKPNVIYERAYKYENNELLPIPIDVGNYLEVWYDRADGTEVRSKAKVDKVKWFIDKEDNKLKCKLITSLVNLDTNKRVCVYLDEYMEKYTISGVTEFFNKTNLKEHIVAFQPNGYIRPIELVCPEGSVIIDNVSVYAKRIGAYSSCVVGGWREDKLEINEELLKQYVNNPKVLRVMKNNKAYLNMLRKSIVPYLVADTRKVKVGKQ